MTYAKERDGNGGVNLGRAVVGVPFDVLSAPTFPRAWTVLFFGVVFGACCTSHQKIE